MRPGGILALHLHVRNDGWASLYNPRPVEVLLATTKGVIGSATLSIDPRAWAPSASAPIDVALRIPASTAAGTYRLMLRLPDAAKELHDVPEYAVQFANDGVWDAATGGNALTDALKVDPSAPGASDPSATTFTQL